jgi:hypothetical protein
MKELDAVDDCLESKKKRENMIYETVSNERERRRKGHATTVICKTVLQLW